MNRNGGKFAEDSELLFLENNTALAGFILDHVERIKNISDDPDVLLEALTIEAHALIIQKRTRDYRAERKVTNSGAN